MTNISRKAVHSGSLRCAVPSRYRGWAVAVAAAWVTFASPAAPSVNAQPPSPLELQVDALSQLYDLDCTDQQLKQLKHFSTNADNDAANAAATQPAAVAAVPASQPSAAYTAALTALRDALLSNDDEKIEDAQGKLDDARDAGNLTPADEIPISEGARQRATKALMVLTTSQVAEYIAAHADEVPSARDTLLDAMDDCRAASKDDFPAVRDRAAEQVALLMGGIGHQKADPIAEKATTLLNDCKQLSDDDYQAQQDQLEDRAQQITAGADPVLGLRRWMVRELAYLLSNPATPAAITAKLAMPSN